MEMDAIQRDILEKLYAEYLSGYLQAVPWQRIYKIQQKEAYLAAARQLHQQGLIKALFSETLSDEAFVGGGITPKGAVLIRGA